MAEKNEAKDKTAEGRTSAEKKTIPSLRKKATDTKFRKDYLVFVDDSSDVADVVHENNKVDVVRQANQRGLRVTGDVELDSSKPVDEHNALCVYSVTVESNDEDNR